MSGKKIHVEKVAGLGEDPTKHYLPNFTHICKIFSHIGTYA
jgi:hypothetical protein